MKKILLATLSALLLAACTAGDYGYYESIGPYSPYNHNEPPAKTLTGKLIFDYAFGTFLSVPELLTQVFKLDECLSAAPADSAAIFSRYFYDWDLTSSAGIWKISRREQMLIIDTGGKPLSEPSADWNVYCNLEGLYIMRDSCRIKHSDTGSVRITIKDGRFAGAFSGSAEFTVEKRLNELSTSRPYLFDLRGTGALRGIQNPDFRIGYSTENFLRQTETFWEGAMNITCTNANKAADDVRASVWGKSRVTITYKGITDEWVYIPQRRYI